MTSGFNITSAQHSEHPAPPVDAPNAQDFATVDNNSRRAGKIEVSSRAIATIAGRAVSQCYGVVGVAAKHPRLSMVETLSPEHYGRGVDVHFVHDHVTIDLYVVLEHGLRISEIAHNIMQSVKFAVERSLGLRVVRVNVNVQALRVSKDQ
ncbi:MAG TPA: Asp23/Gls24 family envelope stress response protein [Ktedonobacterales bacterium]|jgi:uncharacterized alkaline shock family protein YloU|nr:Asp23/Gls24 family envelope stress response protein [Ktedonobacterales bacterium]